MEFINLYLDSVLLCDSPLLYVVPSTQLPNLKEIWDLVTAVKVIKNWHKIIKARDRTDAGTQYVHTSFVAFETQQISGASLVQ